MNDELGPQCTACGATNAAGQRFCTSCGTPLPEPGRPLFADEVADEVPAQETAPTVVLPSCRSCGAALAPGLRFCTECGTPVADAAPPPPPPPPPPAPPGCPRCGAEITPGVSFCTSCGTPLAAGATPPPPPQPVPPYLPDRRRRGLWLAAAAVVLLLGAGAGLGAWFANRDDDSSRATDRGASDEPSSATEDPGDDSSETSDGDDAEPSESASAEPSPSATSEAPAPVTCWDGAPAQQVSECTSPEGRAGLEYVFPSMAGQECSALGASPAIGRTALIQCYGYLDDGTKIKINYSIWDSVDYGIAHYDGKGLVRADSPEVYGWTGRAGRQFNAAFIYTADPISASWYAPTAEGMGLALSTGVVEGRPAGEVRGEPTP